MKHFFDVEIAEKYGVNAAILLENIAYWIRKNEANGTNFFDGNYWTYNSNRAFLELFPYMSERQIRTALQKLQDDGLIITGNYNDKPYDRTLWYALTEKGKSICQNGGIHSVKMTNGSCQNDRPIPDIIPNINKDIKESKTAAKQQPKKNSFDEIIEVYTQDEEIRHLLREWLKVRKSKRAAMTDTAIQMNIAKLDRLAAQSSMTVKQYLEEIICRGWNAFYPIKQFGNQQQQQQPTQQKETSYDLSEFEKLMNQF